MDIKENLQSLKNSIPTSVQVVATSKTHPNEAIVACYAIGHRIFGENKVQELLMKHQSLPKDIEWHFIGHLQTNKIKQIVPFVSLIHGVDSLKVIKEINLQGEKINRKIDILLQIHIAQEETKFGFLIEEVKNFFDTRQYELFPYVNFVGLMGMASNSDDEALIGREFDSIKDLFDYCRRTSNLLGFEKLSIGMSGDYELAIQKGGNLIRIGSMIFGNRDY